MRLFPPPTNFVTSCCENKEEAGAFQSENRTSTPLLPLFNFLRSPLPEIGCDLNLFRFIVYDTPWKNKTLVSERRRGSAFSPMPLKVVLVKERMQEESSFSSRCTGPPKGRNHVPFREYIGNLSFVASPPTFPSIRALLLRTDYRSHFFPPPAQFTALIRARSGPFSFYSGPLVP